MKPAAVLFAGALAAAAAPAAWAAPSVTAAWSRPAVAGSTGGGFMTLANPGKTADALIGVETPLARKAEIHRSTMSGGVMSMRRLERLDLPAGGAVTFAPGGLHLMFVGLTRPLRTGDVLPATLTFASGARLRVEFRVGLSAPAGAHAHH